tara:strand:+ start:709 stop:2553 length:1845 start_codon:yes stop_codon:yes gene_type:complete
MANIGRLTVDLRLASQKFDASLKKATANLGTFRTRANSAIKSMGGMQGRIAALVGVAGFGAMISKSLEAGDSIAKMSDRLGISTENLSAFQHLAQLSGESIEGFDKSIEKMVRSIGEAERGIGTGKVAFEDLGISVDQFAGKNADEQFLIIADAISSLENETLQASLASDIFGRSGIKLLTTIKAGREGFESAREEVDKYGLALNRVDAAKIEAANDAILRAKQAMKGVSMQATVELAPILEEVSNRFVAAATEGEGFGEKVRRGLQSASSFIGVFVDGIHGIEVILKAAEVAIKGFGFVWSQVMTMVVNDVLVPFANKVSNFVLAPIREVLAFGAQFSSVAQGMLDEINQLGNAQSFETLENLAGVMAESFNSSKDELHNLMMETIPSEAMKEKINEVFASAEERAVESAKTVSRVYRQEVATSSGETETTEEEKTPQEELTEKRTYLQRVADLEIGQSKKLAAIKQAIKLKEVVGNQFKAISEAVASAPFPANIPAVAFATAQGLAAVAGVRSAGSFEGGGYTGRGARVGGTDGRGGIPVTVHPNEMIIDMNRQQPSTGAYTPSDNRPSSSNQFNVAFNNTFNGSAGDSIDALERQPRRAKRVLSQLLARPV